MATPLSSNLIFEGEYTPNNIFTLPAITNAEVTGVDINSCSQYGKAIIRLQGSGFSEITSLDVYAEVGGSACLYYEVISDTEIAVVVPPIHSETYPITVDISGTILDYSFSLPGSFTYTAAPAFIGGMRWSKIRDTSTSTVLGLLASEAGDRLLSFEMPASESQEDLQVYKSFDRGITWNQLDSIPYPVMASVQGVWSDCSQKRVVLAIIGPYITNGGIVYYSVNGGVAWGVSPLSNYLTGESPKYLTKLVGSGNWKHQYALLSGDVFALVRSDDYGETWSEAALPNGTVLYDLACSRKDGKYVLATADVEGVPKTLYSSNYGASFTQRTGRPAAQMAGDSDLDPSFLLHPPVVGDAGLFQLAKEITESDNRFSSLLLKGRIEYAASGVLCNSDGSVIIVPRSEIIDDFAAYYYYTTNGNQFSPANIQQIVENVNFGYCGFNRMTLSDNGTLFGVAETSDAQLSGVPGIYVSTIHTASPRFDVVSSETESFEVVAQTSSPSLRWPWNLPGPQMETLAFSRQDNVIRSQMDTGPVMVRRRFTAATRYIKLEWLFTHEQLIAFENFFINNLGSGVSSFLWPIPTETKDVYNIPLQESNYADLFTFIKVRFKGPYEHKRFNGTDKETQRIIDTMNQNSEITGRKVQMFSLWSVSAELEILP